MTNLAAIVLNLLFTKRGWHAFSHLVQEDTFESTEYRRIYKHAAKLHNDIAGDLTADMLGADIEIQYPNKTTVENTLLALEAVVARPVMDLDAAEMLVKKFLERTAGVQIAEHIANNSDKDDFSLAHVSDLAQRALDASHRVRQGVVDIFESEVSGAPNTRPVRYSLGVSRKLDGSLRGGTADGELLIVLAPPARGKSSFLCRIGAKNAKAGLRILHVTLEISTRKVIERYDQCWTGLDSDSLATAYGQQETQTAREAVKRSGGAVWVVNWSYQNASANDIGALVRRMAADDMFVDMIVIDYLELMSPNKIPGREMRQAYAAIGKETRSLACNLNIPIVTAWQANRGGNDALLLAPSDISESWDIVKIADTIIGLNQSSEELRNKHMRVNIIKQRESTERGYFNLYCDLDRMVVRDLSFGDLTQEMKEEVQSALQNDAEAPAAPGS